MFKIGQYVRIIDSHSSNFNRVGKIEEINKQILLLSFIDHSCNTVTIDSCITFKPFKIGEKVKVISLIPIREHSKGNFKEFNFEIDTNPEMQEYQSKIYTIKSYNSWQSSYRLDGCSPWNWSNDLLVPLNSININIF